MRITPNVAVEIQSVPISSTMSHLVECANHSHVCTFGVRGSWFTRGMQFVCTPSSCARCLSLGPTQTFLFAAITDSMCVQCTEPNGRRHVCWAGMAHATIDMLLDKLKADTGVCQTFAEIMELLPDAVHATKVAASLVLIGPSCIDFIVGALRAEHFAPGVRVKYVWEPQSERLCERLCDIACSVLNMHTLLQRASASAENNGDFKPAIVVVERVYLALIRHSTVAALLKLFGTANRSSAELVLSHAVGRFETEDARWHAIDFFRSCGTTLHGKDSRPTGLPISLVSPEYKNGSLSIVHCALKKLACSTWMTQQNVNDAVERMERIGFIQYGCDFFFGSTRGYARDQRKNIPLDDVVRHTFRERASGNITRVLHACDGKHGGAILSSIVRICRAEYLAPTSSSGVDDMEILRKLVNCGSACPHSTIHAIHKMRKAGIVCRRVSKLKGADRGNDVQSGRVQCMLLQLLSTKSVNMLLFLLQDKEIVTMLDDHIAGGCPAGRCNGTKNGNSCDFSHSNLLSSMAASDCGHAQRNITIIMKVHRAYVRRRGGDTTKISFLAGHRHCELHEVVYYRMFAPLALKYGALSDHASASLDMTVRSIHPMAVPLLLITGNTTAASRMMQKMKRIYYRPCHRIISVMFKSGVFVAGSPSMMWDVLYCLTRETAFTAEDLLNPRRCSDVITLLFSLMVSFFKCRGALPNSGGDMLIKACCASESLSKVSTAAILKLDRLCTSLGVVHDRKATNFWCTMCARGETSSTRRRVVCDWRCSANRQSEWMRAQLAIYSRPCHHLTRFGLSSCHRLVYFKQRFDMLDHALRTMLFTLLLIKQRACRQSTSVKQIGMNRMPSYAACTFGDEMLFEQIVSACFLLTT